MLESLFRFLPDLERSRALDVACGDGSLTKDFLSKLFDKIDMFDECPIAIKTVNGWRKDVTVIDRVEQSSIEKFIIHDYYSLIILRWVTGYLKDMELVR